MDKRYQVFVSSTYVDLVDERREVIQALLELDCLPAAMEMFPAADDDQWTLIQRVIDESDYYVLVVGGRYGSMSEEGISYTEREYDYALSSGTPVLGFVHSNPDDIPSGRTDQSDDAREKLEAFRAKVRLRLVKEFSSSAELGSVVSRSLVRLIKDKPAEGWVRGRHAMTPETETEVAQLREQVARAALEAAQEPRFDERKTAGLAQGGESVEIAYVLNDIYTQSNWNGEWFYTWNELIRLLGPAMLDEVSESVLEKRLAADLLREVLDQWDGDELRPRGPVIKIDSRSWDQIKIQLRALGVIDRGIKKRPVADRSMYWRLTDRGDEQLVRLLALKRGEQRAPALPQPGFEDPEREASEPTPVAGETSGG